jgi:drug/metabolite transporter (DMT)-like permease
MSGVYLYLIILFGQIVFASTPLFAKIALRDFDPMTLGLIRFTVSMIILNGFLLVQRKKIIPPKEHWGMILLLGFLALPANQGLFLIGLQYTSPGHSALMYSLTPLFVYMLAIPLLKERLKFKKVIGILIAFAGVVAILLDGNIKMEPNFVWGDLIIFFGVIAWALYTVLGKKLVDKLGSVYAITYTLTAGAFLFVPMGIYNTATFDFTQVDILPWVALAFVTIVTSSIAYPIWYWALKYMEASKLTVFIFLQPVLAALLSYIFLSEELTTNFIVGGSIVILGVILTEKA